MATRDEKRLAQQRRMKGRRGGRPSLMEKANAKPRKETSFDRESLDLRCMNCDRIFNGPHYGEVVKMNSKRYHELQELNRVASNYQNGGISDSICSKRSCIDADTKKHVEWMQQRDPERDLTDYAESYRQSSYDLARNDPDRYPEGLIDDVEPPL